MGLDRRCGTLIESDAQCVDDGIVFCEGHLNVFVFEADKFLGVKFRAHCLNPFYK